jgi:hypothetical protein
MNLNTTFVVSAIQVVARVVLRRGCRDYPLLHGAPPPPRPAIIRAPWPPVLQPRAPVTPTCSCTFDCAGDLLVDRIGATRIIASASAARSRQTPSSASNARRLRTLRTERARTRRTSLAISARCSANLYRDLIQPSLGPVCPVLVMPRVCLKVPYSVFSRPELSG